MPPNQFLLIGYQSIHCLIYPRGKEKSIKGEGEEEALVKTERYHYNEYVALKRIIDSNSEAVAEKGNALLKELNELSSEMDSIKHKQKKYGIFAIISSVAACVAALAAAVGVFL